MLAASVLCLLAVPAAQADRSSAASNQPAADAAALGTYRGGSVRGSNVHVPVREVLRAGFLDSQSRALRSHDMLGSQDGAGSQTGAVPDYVSHESLAGRKADASSLGCLSARRRDGTRDEGLIGGVLMPETAESWSYWRAHPIARAEAAEAEVARLHTLIDYCNNDIAAIGEDSIPRKGTGI